MSLMFSTNLSDRGPKGKGRDKANSPGVDALGSSYRQASTNQNPKNGNKNIETNIHSQDYKQAPSKTDDPWSERDEYGAKLMKDAMVWKVYFKEADKSDAELAALFSAVSTAFLIKSSNMLKQDPNVSAATLVVMSQALVALANNSSVYLAALSMSSHNTASLFSPTYNAVVINTM
ncbi:hypothetical protein RHS03_06567, partial [Rhizoctonia solani]